MTTTSRAEPRIGIQLYSLGPQFAADAPGVLRDLARMGYEGVEFAWVFGGLTPPVLRDLLLDLNLCAISIYAKIDQLRNEEDAIWTYAETLCCRYLTVGCQDLFRDGFRPETARAIEELGKRAARRGPRLLYHNHRTELQSSGDITALDRLFESTDADTVGAELDVAYFVHMGLDPVACVRRYGARSPLLHARDTAADGRSVPVGAGVVDFPGLVAAARKAGTEWLVVEQDPSPDALEAAARSISVLRALSAS